jgi:hypothetical protein
MTATAEKPHSLRGYIREDYLEVSQVADDRGNLVGRNPREIPPAQLRDLGGPTSPIRAIREKCLDCSGGSAAEARKCVAIGCALWPFRMGRNPFYGKSDTAEAAE